MTEEQQAQYEAQGYLVIENAFDGEELNQIQPAFDQAHAAGGLEDLPNQDERFIHLAEHQRVFPIVHRIMSDDVQLRSLHGITFQSGHTGCDWYRLVAPIIGIYHPASTVCVQVLFFLDDVPNDGWCVSVVPGSHRFKENLLPPDMTRVEDMPHHVSLQTAAGSAIVLHGNVWQTRLPHRSSATQRILEYVYIHCWMRQALPRLTPHATEVASQSHNLSQLFGIRTTDMNASWYWGRKVEGYRSSVGLPERKFSKLGVVDKGTTPNR